VSNVLFNLKTVLALPRSLKDVDDQKTSMQYFKCPRK